MLHLIGTIIVWYVAFVLGSWLLAWAVVGTVAFARHIGYALLVVALLAVGAWLFSLNADQLLGLALGSSVLLFVAAAPFVGYRLLHGGRNMDQEITHKLARDRKSMGYDS